MTQPTFTRVEFTNFKAFRRLSVSLDHMNVLVGPNNSGKSTIVSAFRVLEVALRRARARNPERLCGVPGQPLGYPITKTTLPISTENVWTDYEKVDACIQFKLSTGSTLTIH